MKAWIVSVGQSFISMYTYLRLEVKRAHPFIKTCKISPSIVRRLGLHHHHRSLPNFNLRRGAHCLLGNNARTSGTSSRIVIVRVTPHSSSGTFFWLRCVRTDVVSSPGTEVKRARIHFQFGVVSRGLFYSSRMDASTNKPVDSCSPGQTNAYCRRYPTLGKFTLMYH